MNFSKQVIGGTGLIALAGAGARLLSLITVPVMSHLLGPEVYGVAALAGAIISLGTILALLGIDMAYARFSLQNELAQRAGVEVFCWRFAATGAIMTAGAVGLGWYWWGHIWLPKEHIWVALYSIVSVLLSAAVTMATTRVRLAGHYRKLAAVSMVASMVSVVVSLVVANFWRTDVWALFLGMLTSALTSLGMLGLPSPKILLRRSALSPKLKRDVVALGVVGSITAPMYWIISSCDRWFLAKFATDYVIGVYSMASSIALMGLMLNSALFLTWFPEASRVYGEKRLDALATLGRLWMRLVVGLALVWVAVAAAGGDSLRLLAAPKFHSGAAYIPWLAGGVFFYGLAGLANTAFLLQGRMGPVASFWAFGALVSSALNILLIPVLSALGAAMAQTASFALIALCILIASRRTLYFAIDWLRLGLCLLIALTTGILMSPSWAPSPLLSLLIKAPVGLFVVILLCALIAPDWFKRGYETAKRLFFPGMP